MLPEDLWGLGILTGYFLLAGSLALLFKRILKAPPELTRKLLHLVVVMSIFVLLSVFRTWYVAVLAVFMFACAAYPVLHLAERSPKYGAFFSERKSGEVKTSLILVFGMISVLTAVFWGCMGGGCKYIIIVAIMAWGFGDAAAALIGKAYGRRFIDHRLVEGKKTLEGTLAMFAVSWLAIFITTMIYTAQPWYICFLTALLVAPVCAVVELFSRNGMDTVTVPLSTAVSTFTFLSLFTFLEGMA